MSKNKANAVFFEAILVRYGFKNFLMPAIPEFIFSNHG